MSEQFMNAGEAGLSVPRHIAIILDGNGRFSNESAVSYVELVSGDGAVCTAKIGLLEGRGAGSFRIPASTSTGTYRLVAYTAVNAAETGTPWKAGSRLLTIFNSTSRARVADGVDLVDDVEVFTKLSGLVDFEEERKRLEKRKKQATKDLEKLEKKLANKNFLEKAAPEAVQKVRDEHAELTAALKLINAQLS